MSPLPSTTDSVDAPSALRYVAVTIERWMEMRTLLRAARLSSYDNMAYARECALFEVSEETLRRVTVKLPLLPTRRATPRRSRCCLLCYHVATETEAREYSHSRYGVMNAYRNAVANSMRLYNTRMGHGTQRVPRESTPADRHCPNQNR